MSQHKRDWNKHRERVVDRLHREVSDLQQQHPDMPASAIFNAIVINRLARHEVALLDALTTLGALTRTINELTIRLSQGGTVQ
jgi:hypothetical protein